MRGHGLFYKKLWIALFLVSFLCDESSSLSQKRKPKTKKRYAPRLFQWSVSVQHRQRPVDNADKQKVSETDFLHSRRL